MGLVQRLGEVENPNADDELVSRYDKLSQVQRVEM